jgi:hypothetical protein
MTKAANKIAPELAVQQEVQAIINEMPLEDLLGAPIPAPVKPAKFVGPKAPKVVLTEAEKKAKRNEAQKALRATPEGRAYANAASKKSIAAKKERRDAELARLKALVAALEPVQPEAPAADVAAAIALKEEEAEVIKKPSTKARGSKKTAQEQVGEATL